MAYGGDGVDHNIALRLERIPVFSDTDTVGEEKHSDEAPSDKEGRTGLREVSNRSTTETEPAPTFQPDTPSTSTSNVHSTAIVQYQDSRRLTISISLPLPSPRSAPSLIRYSECEDYDDYNEVFAVVRGMSAISDVRSERRREVQQERPSSHPHRRDPATVAVVAPVRRRRVQSEPSDEEKQLAWRRVARQLGDIALRYEQDNPHQFVSLRRTVRQSWSVTATIQQVLSVTWQTARVFTRRRRPLEEGPRMRSLTN